MEEWRGYEEPRQDNRCISVSDALKKLMPRLGLRERFDEGEIQRAWKEMVGDFLAAHSVPFRYADGIVHIRVLQPSVRYELERHWKTDILKKLRKRFGARTIRNIRFSL